MAAKTGGTTRAKKRKTAKGGPRQLTLRVSFIKAKRALRPYPADTQLQSNISLPANHVSITATTLKSAALFAREIVNVASPNIALPDISGAFRGELAALLAFYAGRIAAAQLSGRATDVSAIVQIIVNEQNVAVRELMDRWQSATKRHQQENSSTPPPRSPSS